MRRERYLTVTDGDEDTVLRQWEELPEDVGEELELLTDEDLSILLGDEPS